MRPSGCFIRPHLALRATWVWDLCTKRSRPNQKALQFWRVLNSLKHEKPVKECFDIQARSLQKREAPDICPVCPVVNPALSSSVVPDKEQRIHVNLPVGDFRCWWLFIYKSQKTVTTCTEAAVRAKPQLKQWLLSGLSMGMGFLWESHGKRPMGWDSHNKLLWEGNGTDKYIPWTSLGLSMGMSFLWESHGKRPMGWDRHKLL